jgi:hypothetical protein
MEPATSPSSSSNSEMRQRERRPGRQLLDNTKPALAQPSTAVGYRREQEELLVLRDPGSDGRSGGWGVGWA